MLVRDTSVSWIGVWTAVTAIWGMACGLVAQKKTSHDLASYSRASIPAILATCLGRERLNSEPSISGPRLDPGLWISFHGCGSCRGVQSCDGLTV